MRNTLSLTFFLLLFPQLGSAQILHLTDLNTEQIRALDQQRTVLIIPGGILEEHGPYLPCYTDGYSDIAYSDALARAIVARQGWTVVLFPPIPIGSNPANEIGNKWPFPGSFAVRMSTVRTLYMDLADDLGQQRFRWIFLIHKHGGPGNNRALDQASDYFHDIYGGTMVHLFGVEVIAEESDRVQKNVLTEAQLKENGLPVHADAGETSDLLYIRPDLVSTNYRQARTISGATFSDLRTLASRMTGLDISGLHDSRLQVKVRNSSRRGRRSSTNMHLRYSMATTTARSPGTVTGLLMLSSQGEIPPYSKKKARKLSVSNNG
jgi:creatinine amidohydrolase/Fe(II)-dependent formamide hydrolase-like protein